MKTETIVAMCILAASVVIVALVLNLRIYALESRVKNLEARFCVNGADHRQGHGSRRPWFLESVLLEREPDAVGTLPREAAMTADALRALPTSALQARYATLRADALPVGTFTGRAWLAGAPSSATLLRLVWRGKVFDGIWVRNRLLGLTLVTGYAYLSIGDPEVRIYYRQLGLTDYLRPVSPTLWLGWTQVRGVMVWFTLEAQS